MTEAKLDSTSSPVNPNLEALAGVVVASADLMALTAITHDLLAKNYRRAVTTGLVFGGLVVAQKIAGEYRSAWSELSGKKLNGHSFQPFLDFISKR